MFIFPKNKSMTDTFFKTENESNSSNRSSANDAHLLTCRQTGRGRDGIVKLTPSYPRALEISKSRQNIDMDFYRIIIFARIYYLHEKAKTSVLYYSISDFR
jgi:hypothetical protein